MYEVITYLIFLDKNIVWFIKFYFMTLKKKKIFPERNDAVDPLRLNK